MAHLMHMVEQNLTGNSARHTTEFTL